MDLKNTKVVNTTIGSRIYVEFNESTNILQ